MKSIIMNSDLLISSDLLSYLIFIFHFSVCFITGFVNTVGILILNRMNMLNTKFASHAMESYIGPHAQFKTKEEKSLPTLLLHKILW